MGENKIRSHHQSDAKRLGISEDSFRGRQIWRHLFVTNRVNAQGVSNAESIAAARHKSASAHIVYQETDVVNDGNRTLALP